MFHFVPSTIMMVIIFILIEFLMINIFEGPHISIWMSSEATVTEQRSQFAAFLTLLAKREFFKFLLTSSKKQNPLFLLSKVNIKGRGCCFLPSSSLHQVKQRKCHNLFIVMETCGDYYGKEGRGSECQGFTTITLLYKRCRFFPTKLI